MVEVFKTNVTKRGDAAIVIARIHKVFIDYKASFDLEDCDKILRVKSAATQMNAYEVIRLLNNMGFQAEILPDEKPSVIEMLLYEKEYYPVLK